MHAPRRPRSALRGRLRRTAAIAAADVTAALTRATGRHGTALPGLVARRIDRTILASMAEGLSPVVLIIGTNGKTTTTRLTAAILERALSVRPVSNRSGANLEQGLVSAILADRRRAIGPRPAVFEVDELAFPDVAAVVRPDVIVMLNLVRDQLDRYGEVDAVERRWVGALGRLRRDTQLIVCADDPRLETIARHADLPARRFGLVGDVSLVRPEADSGSSGESIGAPCPSCGAGTTVGDASASAGAWECLACGERRAPLDLGVRVVGFDREWLRLEFESGGASDVPVDATTDQRAAARVGLTGTAGAHDAAAAVLAAMTLGLPLARAVAGVDGATPAFGRLEEIAVDGRRVVLTLAKNPASAAQAAEAVSERRPDGVLLGLGDRHADGRDVSWIWDAPIESLARLAPLTLTGDRADDLAVRFKYALQRPGDAHPRPVVDPAIEHALAASLRRVPPGGTLMVLGTYTTLLGIRRLLERRGLATAMPR